MGAKEVIGGLTLGLSLQQSRQARKQTKKAERLDERRSKLQASRSAVESIRKAQVARAQILQAGENQGVGGSSAVAGGVASIASSTAGNLGFADQLFKLQQSSRRLRQSAADFSGNSQSITQVGNFAASLVGGTANVDGSLASLTNKNNATLSNINGLT